jgi:sec-independent protein translocase protein TatB
MNILGMGPLELLLILVLALIVFGPARLPEIMGQIGRAIADFRRATSQLSDEFNRTIQAELNETRQMVEETRAALNEAKTTVTDAHATVTTAVAAPIAAPQRVAVPAAAVNGTTVEPNGSAAVGAAAPVAEAPPLADTSQWSWETSPATPPAASSPAPEPGPSVPSVLSPEQSAATRPPAPTLRPSRERSPRHDELAPPY